MFSRAFVQGLRRCRTPSRRIISRHAPRLQPSTGPARLAYPVQRVASFATEAPASSDIEEQIEEIQELYATAKDEFEIAMEETEKMSVYAEDDRQAAKEELGKLQEAFQAAIRGPNGEEVKRRIGQRIRELENAVQNMENLAMEQD